MVPDVSEAQQACLDANAQEGHLCSDMAPQSVCADPASVRVTVEMRSALHDRIEVPRELVLALCPWHATRYPVGYPGRNFTVLRHEDY
jgi:hypothetical protein